MLKRGMEGKDFFYFKNILLIGLLFTIGDLIAS